MTAEKYGRVVAWHKPSFSLHCEFPEINWLSKAEKLDINSTKIKTTNTLFVFKMIWRENLLEVFKYSNLAVDPKMFTKHKLSFPKRFPGWFEVNVHCNNSILIEYKKAQCANVVEVYTQDTLEQAWAPVDIVVKKSRGSTSPILTQDRFLFLNDGYDNLICYEKGVWKHKHDATRFGGELMGIGKRLVIVETAGFFSSAPVDPQRRPKLWSLDPENNVCQEVETFSQFKDENFCIRTIGTCLLYTSPSPRDRQKSRMPSSA